MSIESAQQFIGRMKEDQAFREMILSTKSQAEAEQMVQSQGYDFTVDEVKSLVQPREAELNEEQLEAVTGGGASWVLLCSGGGIEWISNW